MKTNRYIMLAAMMPVIACGLYSCSEDATIGSFLRQGDSPITFTTTVESTTDVTRGSYDAISLQGDGQQLWLLPSVSATDDAITRGTQIRSVAAIDSFGVSAFRHSSGDLDLSGATPSYMYDQKAAKDGDGNYIISQDLFWPSNDEVLDFQAYYPYNKTNITLSGKNVAGNQTIAFTVNTDVTKQCDLMTATARDESFKTLLTPSVPLKFYHRLCVRFVVGSQFISQGYVKKITLKGVYKTGTYTMGQAVGSGWSNMGQKGDFKVEHTADQNLTGAAVGDAITDLDETFLMIPQDFTDPSETASVEVVYWDGVRDYTLNASLKDEVWAEGTTVTYALSSESLTTLKIDAINFANTVSGAPKTGWADGDVVGMYVVDGNVVANDAEHDGKRLVYENIPVTYDATHTAWNINHNTSQGAVFHKPGYKYYFYYPYKAGEQGNRPAGYPEESPVLNASATEFFSSVIYAHTVYSDQSNSNEAAGNFLNSDLQVCKGVVPEDANSGLAVSTIRATMARQVGLAVIQIGTKSAKKKVTFLNGSTTGTVNETADVTASEVFSGNKPYLNGTLYYYYTKANQSTSFNSASTEKEAWHEALVFNLDAGATETKIAYSDRAYWPYINAVWNYSNSGRYVWTGASQATYTYTLTVWGASGGGRIEQNLSSHRGLGGYSTGSYTTSSTSQSLYVFVGGKGIKHDGTSGEMSGATTGIYSPGTGGGGYNGGGNGKASNAWDCYGGGGMTHISTTDNLATTTWSSTGTLIVAGGGGGADNLKDVENEWTSDDGSGGYGGGLVAGKAHDGSSYSSLDAASQTTGYRQGVGESASSTSGERGGGGAGWWGGYASNGDNCGGGGGSGYIGGVSNGNTIAGNTSFPAPGGGNETGHAGNGYARITLTRW